MINSLILLNIILQVGLESYGFGEVAQQSTLFALLVSIILILATSVVFLYKSNEKKSDKIAELQKQFGQTLSEMQKTHQNKIDDIRKENVHKEIENNRVWRESENNTLNVLNGVTKVLEMNEKSSENENKLILSKLEDVLHKLDELSHQIK